MPSTFRNGGSLLAAPAGACACARLTATTADRVMARSAGDERRKREDSWAKAANAEGKMQAEVRG